MQLLESINSFIVVERDGSIIACAALFPFFKEKCGEVAAIAVSPECRGNGQGDKLLGNICNFVGYLHHSLHLSYAIASLNGIEIKFACGYI